MTTRIQQAEEEEEEEDSFVDEPPSSEEAVLEHAKKAVDDGGTAVAANHRKERRRSSSSGGGGVLSVIDNRHACSVPFFVSLMIMAAIILGVTLGLTLGNGEDDESSSSTMVLAPQPPTMSPVLYIPTASSPNITAAPVLQVPTKPPPSEMTREEYFQSLAIQWSGPEAFLLQNQEEDDGVGTDNTTTAIILSPARQALKWLTTIDPLNLAKNASERDIRQRYIAAVLYYATQGRFWEEDGDNRKLSSRSRSRNLQTPEQLFGFLSELDVCDWNDDEFDTGLFCDANGNIQTISLCKRNNTLVASGMNEETPPQHYVLGASPMYSLFRCMLIQLSIIRA